MLQKIKIYLAKKLSDLSRLLYDKKADTTIIVIEGLTKAQKIALEDMLRTWEWLGNIGGSSWTGFYADGDGNFKPKIIIDGRKPEFTKLIDRKELWDDDEYKIDFDIIAWALHKD